VQSREDFEDEMTVSRKQLRAGASDALVGFIQELAPWHLFGGLTFDQRRCRHERIGGTMVPCRIPVDVARGRFQRYIAGAQRALGRRIEYVVGLEAQRNGWPHFHPLLSLEGGLQTGDVVCLGGLWYEANGYGRLEAPRSVDDVTGYCAKYLLKDVAIGDLLISTGLRSVNGGRPSEGA
jgi:hypothetical protein